MKPTTNITMMLVVALVLAACGSSGDSATTGGDSAAEGGTEAAAPTVDRCEFEPARPGVIGLGTVTLSGTNTSGDLLDIVQISYNVLDEGGAVVSDSSAFVTYWRDGESIALLASPLGEDGAVPVGCEVAEVSVNTYDDSNVLPDGATCAIGESTGSIGGPPISVDLSGVDGLPGDVDLYVETALLNNGARVTQQPVTVPAGETSFEMPMLAGEAGWTCDVLVIREV